MLRLWNAMWKNPKPYRWTTISDTPRRSSVLELGLSSESGLYPSVDLVFTSVEEIEELSNTLRGVAHRIRSGRKDRAALRVVQAIDERSK